MSIKEKAAEIKGYTKAALLPGGKADGIPSIVLMVLLATASFFLGKMSTFPQGVLPDPVPMTKQEAALTEGTSNETTAHASTTVGTTTRGSVSSEGREGAASDAVKKAEGVYVGSRKGTKYHLPWCAGGRTISEANKVWFASKEDAAAKGYAPAQNCKGI